MRSIRLLPIVVFATFALLVLKTVGLVTQGGYVLTGAQSVFAQSESADDPAALFADNGLSAREREAAQRASDNLFSRAEPAPLSSAQLDAVPVTENSLGEKVAIGPTDGVDETERAVLDRLSERRAELDVLEASLDTRKALVEAAEKRLAERITGLEAVEARIEALVAEKKALDDEQFAGVVGMYETMKPRDAAAIFNTLGADVLVRVAQHMNPRKLAPVMAEMDTERARDLTMRLAEVEPEPSLDAEVSDLENLPQIIGE